MKEKGDFKMKKLINNREHFVGDMLAGLKITDPNIDLSLIHI